jgi:hypothetical protein
VTRRAAPLLAEAQVWTRSRDPHRGASHDAPDRRAPRRARTAARDTGNQQMPISVPASKTREVPLYDPATRPASSLESPQMRSIARARRSLASCAIGLSSGLPASSKADSGSIADT